MKNMTAVILAAGEGKRMFSNRAKTLHTILGKPMLSYCIQAAQSAGAKICVVVGHKGEEVMQKVGVHPSIEYVWQREQLGTGHAVMMAKDHFDETVIILNGDGPLITKTTIENAISYHEAQANAVTVISACVPDSTGYGRIVRSGTGDFLKIVEHNDATEDEKQITEINTGMYIFRKEALQEALRYLKNDTAQGEYYLTDTVEILKGMGKKVDAMLQDNYQEFAGVNDRVQLADAEKIMQERINRYWMEKGVTIMDPGHTYIGIDVTIGQDTVVYPGAILMGTCTIGEGCMIGPHTQITDCSVGNYSQINQSVLMDSVIGKNTTIGPFAYIRPNSHIGDKVKIGDFVEVKNSTIGNGTKVSHLTYVGDSDVGENINFGCGTVTVNYDGKEKYRTVIEDNVFIGCNANLVAPVRIRENSYIAAGSTITEDVPENSLAIARSRQTVKTEYGKKN